MPSESADYRRLQHFWDEKFVSSLLCPISLLIHPSGTTEENCIIGSGCTIGMGVVLGTNQAVEDNTTVFGPNANRQSTPNAKQVRNTTISSNNPLTKQHRIIYYCTTNISKFFTKSSSNKAFSCDLDYALRRGSICKEVRRQQASNKPAYIII